MEYPCIQEPWSNGNPSWAFTTSSCTIGRAYSKHASPGQWMRKPCGLRVQGLTYQHGKISSNLQIVSASVQKTLILSLGSLGHCFYSMLTICTPFLSLGLKIIRPHWFICGEQMLFTYILVSFWHLTEQNVLAFASQEKSENWVQSSCNECYVEILEMPGVEAGQAGRLWKLQVIYSPWFKKNAANACVF